MVGDISATDTTITVSSTVPLASNGYVQIGNEVIYYNTVVGNELQLCARGQANTTAVAHLTGAAISVPNLPSINVWPTPNSGGNYTFVAYRLRRIQDAGSGVQTQDIPFRFLPPMIAGLAYYLSQKVPEASGRIEMLKNSYEEQWTFASQEDREKASLRLAPRQMFW